MVGRKMTYNYLSRANIQKRNKIIQEKWDNFGKLNPEEREVINEVYEAMRSCVNMLNDCQDLYISDVRQLDTATYHLKSLWAIGRELESLEDEDDEKI